MTTDGTPVARAYVPATFATVAQLRDSGAVPAGAAYAVTEALRAEMGDDDQEVLEYAAFAQAAQDSLELLRADPALPRRRVVFAVDAPVTPVGGEETESDSARVALADAVPHAAVAAVHVDGPDAVAEITEVLAEPDPDDGLTEIDHELEWYDASELATLTSRSEPSS